MGVGTKKAKHNLDRAATVVPVPGCLLAVALNNFLQKRRLLTPNGAGHGWGFVENQQAAFDNAVVYDRRLILCDGRIRRL